MSNSKRTSTEVANKAAQPKYKGVGALARKLLAETDQSYAEIVETIRAAHPSAKTTARSVASLACNLRKSGVEVPSRRSAKKEG